MGQDSNSVGHDPGKSPSPSPQHRRGYQACDPCRKRKVKCDLGSVDNPRPPPCVRCRRESKRCEFSATRRKRKLSEPPEENEEEEEPAVLRRDKRMMIGEVAAKKESSNDPPPFIPSEPSLSNDGFRARSRWPEAPPPAAVAAVAAPAAPQRYTPSAPITSSARHFMEPRNPRVSGYAGSERNSVPGYGGPPMLNRTAVELLSPAITNTHDALHLLSEAAGRTEDLNRFAARQSVSSFNSGPSPLAHVNSPGNISGSFSRTPRSGVSIGGNGFYQGAGAGVVDPQMAGDTGHQDEATNSQDPGYMDAVRAWSRLRFVRAGWMTVEEGMDYVAYYYENLAPMSPVVTPDYSDPSKHRTLLTEEPVLAVTILTIASRHLKPKGDGASTRAFYIHDRLWSYLRGMIERLFWGQEKFDAGGPGTSKPRSLDLAPTSSRPSVKGNLRALGTVEALLILTDWHPRNLHFPPGDDENTLLDTDAHAQNCADKDLDPDSEQAKTSPEGRLAFQKWLEPAWRSDRMSWMLLSTAQALAFELGVFDEKSDSKGASESPAEQVRKRRLRRLILIFITHSSGRLGIPSMLPLPEWGQDVPGNNFDPNESNPDIDRMQDCWMGISKIVYQANHQLFASSEQTSELIKSGRYREQIDWFQPQLREFRQHIDRVNLKPAMRSILLIEYEYTRLYVNSLALQAVVDRWTTMSNESAQDPSGRPGSGPSPGSTGWFRTLMELYRVNEQYIQEVVDASRKILQTVLEGLVPGGRLKHAPIRTFFRILSGMIFILKTFTLGAREDDVRVSLDLQDRTVEALRTFVVDDVHISNTVARLLELLTSSIRTRFLRFAPHDRGVDGEGQDRGSAPGSQAQSPPRDNVSGRRDGLQTPWSSTQDATPSGLGYVESSSAGGHPSGAIGSAHDPLANIPAQTINSSNMNVSFMPPPPSVYYNYYDSNSSMPTNDLERSSPNHVVSSQAVDSNGANAGLPDWFALPLDQFFNSSTAVVDQGLGGTGPMLGEFDMLEVLLNEGGYDGNPPSEGDSGPMASQFM
ncbi:uncharacterized protein N7483_010294 [Penicillium malachiteum]|uniref:uncharacterized protein n=1 Tax=Penicillium malachiteum TaxID=1324776 RepID=UPI00254970E6|nr:uncharacterized protein N7483_010294 [Penicillium malachiteum]KAJ5713113.1 hypothetical protein N7483_010294 [Penicillium malachiteum]